MPWIPEFRPEKGADGYWRVRIPAKFSKTGKRARPTFKTREEAKQFRKELMESLDNYGASSSLLPPAEAEDAKRALENIDGMGVTLRDVAHFYRLAKE